MTSPTTPVPGSVLDGESARLLVEGDLLLSTDTDLVSFSCFGDDDDLICSIDATTSWRDRAGGFTFIGRPDQDGWIKWSGGENPVGNAQVEVQWRGGRKFQGEADDTAQFDWAHRNDHADIIAFRPHREVSGEGNGSLPAAPSVPTEQALAVARLGLYANAKLSIETKKHRADLRKTLRLALKGSLSSPSLGTSPSASEPNPSPLPSEGESAGQGQDGPWGQFARAICESEGRTWLALDNPRADCERWIKAGQACAALASPTEQASDVSGLVEALEKISEGGPDCGQIIRRTYHHGFDQGCAWAGRVARQALSQAQQVKND